jgi:hypothetical protein
MGRSRWLSVVVVVTGCGRVDFDALRDARRDDAPTVLPDGVPPDSFVGLCRFGLGTVIQSGITADDNMAATLPPALAAGCATSPIIRVVSQDLAGILDPTSGRPLLPTDDLGVLGGGDAFQRAVAYLIMADTPVVVDASGTTHTLIERATGTVIASFPASSLSNTHDVGLVMIVDEPISGGSYLTAFGRSAAGTVAAGVLFTSRIAPAIRTDRHQWYAFEWMDSDVMAGPSAGDTFNVVGAGP